VEILHLSKPDRSLRGDVVLEGSKSLSNRALIALALAGADPAAWLSNLSVSKDTATLLQLLQRPADVYDAGDAGTAFRFLTAYLALQPGTQVLTGSARMQERPIGPLVEALRTLGADITYLGKSGFPPLRIAEGRFSESGNGQSAALLHINADVSSQFLSALLLIGPYLPGGLMLAPEGRFVSRPYLDMTMQVMRHFGAEVGFFVAENFTAETQRRGDTILHREKTPRLRASAVKNNGAFVVQPGRYQPRPLAIEADWSAASYWYAMAAFAEEAELNLHGLWPNSWQGDSVLTAMLEPFGVRTAPPPAPPPEGRGDVAASVEYALACSTAPLPSGGGAGGGAVHLTHTTALPEQFHWDFRACPDLAQTLAVVCAGLGVPGVFSGLETLAIKETDRCAALAAELAKVGVRFEPDAQVPGQYLLRGKAAWQTPPRFATYGDHRMALALAPLALFGPIELENPDVVAKSYSAFWEHLRAVGFVLKKTTAP